MDTSSFATSLKRLSRRHDTVAIRITDPIEENFPAIGLVDFLDPETGDVFTMDTSSPLFRKHYKQQHKEFEELVQEELKKAKIDVVELTNGQDFVEPLATYFKKRNR